MSGQALDLKRSAQIVRRYKVLVGVAAAVGLLAGAGYALLNPPMLSSSALVVLPVDSHEIATQVVIAESDPVLSAALPHTGSAMSLTTLRSRIQVTSLTGNVLSFAAEGKTAAQAEQTADAVAQSFVGYISSGISVIGKLPARLVAPAANATGSSLPLDLAITGVVGALFGALAGAIAALALARGDRRLRQRDDIADAIGVPVVASIATGHPSDAPGWAKLLAEYEPGVIHAWSMRRALNQLGLADLDLKGANPDEGASVAVVSFSSDRKALAVGPQLAVFAAALGIPTTLVIGPQQDENVTAPLRAAGMALAAQPAEGNRYLRVAAEGEQYAAGRPGSLAVIVAVVDGQEPRMTDRMRAAVTVLGVSAGAATAEQLARVAVSAASSRRDIAGIIVADPDPADHTTGRLPQPARPARRRQPTRLTGTTTETRR
jgi:capsular polysaccharide biosynthesis protein